ncbi:MAG: hypothetical protein V4469_00440 [Patescibacteria group bacterium]
MKNDPITLDAYEKFFYVLWASNAKVPLSKVLRAVIYYELDQNKLNSEDLRILRSRPDDGVAKLLFTLSYEAPP